jgi:trehalose synthase-fused probable maltokinase
VAGETGAVHGIPTSAFPVALGEGLPVRRLAGEQSNTSVTFGDALILKHFRRLQEGVNPEAEITRFLTERTSFTHTPRLAGHLEYRTRDGVTTLGVVQELVPGVRDGWQWMLERLDDVHRRARAQGGHAETSAVRELAADTLGALRRLGERTAELHRALASSATDPDFAPEPITRDDVADWVAAVQRQIAEARRVTGDSGLAADPRGLTHALGTLVGCVKIRHHGDFHLGQTLYQLAAADFMIIDFEGEPLRPLAERRRKHTPVRDVAGMLRSINYAAVSAGGEATPARDAWAAAWEAEARGAFRDGYRCLAADAPFLPGRAGAFTRAVAAFELEKAAYEIVYEANNRPEWIAIPARGFVSASAALARRSEAGEA